eukprot:3954806-Ditylum_brightwellii.AAC.1
MDNIGVVDNSGMSPLLEPHALNFQHEQLSLSPQHNSKDGHMDNSGVVDNSGMSPSLQLLPHALNIQHEHLHIVDNRTHDISALMMMDINVQCNTGVQDQGHDDLASMGG